MATTGVSRLLALVFLEMLLPGGAPLLQASQTWTLLKVQQLLGLPPVLRHWHRTTDFCGGTGTVAPSASFVCYGDTVTQLHVVGSI
ncbi:putative inactive leucine-rich repeat receptor-like protein kinase [Hordeum vulgare]|nr:putative inactive leucine-rich repeat receptor-like protein kinase [Hordeum vulgare]